MSFAKPKPTNPATKFIEFKGDTGVFQYWDKVNQVNIEIPLPIKFVTVAEFSTITGFNKANKCGVYSNEVYNLNEPLSVRLFCKGNHGVNGIYSQIKGQINSLGGKFAKSIYALMIDGKDVELVNFKITGAFLNAWIDKKVNADEMGICINDMTPEKNGNVEYKKPVIEGFIIKDVSKTRELAQKYLKLLEDYFADKRAYFEEENAVKNDTIEPGYEKSPVVIDGSNKDSIYKVFGEQTREPDNNPPVNDDNLPF